MKKLSNTMKALTIPTLLLFLLTFGVSSVFGQQSCGTNIDQCTVNLQNGGTATTNYPTDLSSTMAPDPARTFQSHSITWNGCTPSSTCPGPVSFSYYVEAYNRGADVGENIQISLTGTGTWSNGAIQYSVTGGSCTVTYTTLSGTTQSTASVLD